MKIAAMTAGMVVGWQVLPAYATQQHGGPEGLYVHQAAHLFFAIAMGLLIYWLYKWRLARRNGWRQIRHAAVFFIAWNLVTIFSHWIEEQSMLIRVERSGPMQLTITTAEGLDWLAALFYLSKLDHLFCVPALLFLFLGLRRLLNAPPAGDESGEPA